MSDPLHGDPPGGLVIVTCMHGRHRLTDLWLDHCSSLAKIYAATSIGDVQTHKLCERYAVPYVIVPNSPLSNKHNAALELALQDTGWTHAMLLPSDDFIDPRWLADGVGDYVMPSRCGMYDAATGRSKVLTCKPRGARHFGAGRVVSRKALEDVWPLWREGKERGLDTLSHARLTAAGWEMEVRQTDYLPVTDIKTGENLWGFDTFARNVGAAEDVLAMVKDRAAIEALR